MLLQHSTLLNSENDAAAVAAASLNMCCWGFILRTTSSTLSFIQPIDHIPNIIYNNNTEHALSPGSHIERKLRLLLGKSHERALKKIQWFAHFFLYCSAQTPVFSVCLQPQMSDLAVNDTEL